MHEKNCFVTLTYDPQSLPSTGSLSKRDWQLFAKKLRKKVGSFRFFMCGEYGENTNRPHYHALLFGVNFDFDRVVYQVTPHRLYRSETLEKVWGKGRCPFGEVTFESAQYVAKYCLKKVNGAKAEEEGVYWRADPETGEAWEVEPEFALMSRRPGIGATWFEKYKSDVFPRDGCIVEGRKVRVPRYYDTKLSEEELLEYKEKRRALVAKRRHELTPERLRHREAYAEEKARGDRRTRV